jgi:hypothetical protein
MGKAAVERSIDEFDERRVVRIVLDTYREVAARKGRDDLASVFDLPEGSGRSTTEGVISRR